MSKVPENRTDKFEFKFPEGYNIPDKVDLNSDDIRKAGAEDVEHLQKQLDAAIEKRKNTVERKKNAEQEIQKLNEELDKVENEITDAIFEDRPLQQLQARAKDLNADISTKQMVVKSLSSAIPILDETIRHYQSDLKNSQCAEPVANLVDIMPRYNKLALEMAELLQKIGKNMFIINQNDPELIRRNNIPGIDFKEIGKILNHIDRVPICYYGFSEPIEFQPKNAKYRFCFRSEFDLSASYAHRRDFTHEEPWQEVSPYLPHALEGTPEEGNISR